jgi:hypothetical protein
MRPSTGVISSRSKSDFAAIAAMFTDRLDAGDAAGAHADRLP